MNTIQPSTNALTHLFSAHGTLASYAAAAGLIIGLASGCGWQGRSGNCGDGDIDGAAEQCDDGDENKPAEEAEPGDCTRSCIRIPLCGNNIHEPDEPCDEGRTGGKWCTGDCEQIPGCGNGVKEVGEECDNGDKADKFPGDDLPSNVAPADANEGECTTACTLAACGDNIKNNDEQCDGGDGCEANCTLTPAVCGNGIVEFGEDCDDAANGNNDDDCTDNCQAPRCGDTFVQESLAETCDLGDEKNNDSGICTTECKDASCGDGHIFTDAEQCDDGQDNGPYKACRTDCKLNICGDGDQGPEEACDDGNTVSGDSCDATCTCAPVCGDANPECGEECDDGNDKDEDECSNECRLPRWVFITDAIEGDLGGLLGADTLCVMAAMIKGFTGTYMAWLSDDSTGPYERFGSTDFSGWYRLPPFDAPRPMAKGWAGLTIDLMNAPSNMQGDDFNVWTNTDREGKPISDINHCNNWTDGSSDRSGVRGHAKPVVVDEKWTENDTVVCNNASRLYCFQVSK